MAAAGLSMVLAMVVLVASYGATPIRSTSSSHSLRSTSGHGKPGTTTGTQGAGSGPGPSSGHVPPAITLLPGKTIARFAGHTSARPAGFTVPRPGSWGLLWRYSCQPGRPGSFTVSETHTAMSGTVDVASTSGHGHGLVWLARDPGRHMLLIGADCTWRIRVILPKR